MSLSIFINTLDYVFKFLGIMIFIAAFLSVIGIRPAPMDLHPWVIIGFFIGIFVVTVINQYYFM